MTTPIRTSLVLLTLALSCAKQPPSGKAVAGASPERSRETGDDVRAREESSDEGNNEILTPASRDLSRTDAAKDSPTSSGEGTPGAAQAEASPQAPVKAPDVIYVPTPQVIVDKMLDLAKVTRDDVVYDLGCGDGRIVVTAAKKYGARAYGFDVDPKRIEEARANVAKNNVGDLVTIEQKDIFTLDLSPANVVTLYLLPSLNQRLLPQLEQLAPGSRVVSHDYDIASLVPVEHLALRPRENEREHDIYFWTVPFQRKASLPPLGVPGPRVK